MTNAAGDESSVCILPARPGDLQAIYDIAEACFPVPWPLDELAKELTRPYSGLRVLRPSSEQKVAGFLNYWRVGEEIQIMNVAVAPAQRRKGYGAALLSDLCRRGRSLGATAVVLEVRRSNASAIALYERHGFVRVGIRPRYYSDNHEDALVMRLPLATP